MLKKTKSYKILIFFFLFSVVSLGPVSSALLKLDFATSAIEGKTIFGVDGGTSYSSADHAACHPIPLLNCKAQF